jgi:hypothetical protein
MEQVKDTPRGNVVKRMAPIALVAILGLAVAGCGSGSDTGTNNAPTTTAPAAGTTAPATPTTAPAPATTTPATTAPKSGGAGF